ncbi:MAG: SIMPL domain-containing protein, partial [Patescibacteria group bacterium]
QKFVLSILGVVASAAVITAPSWFMRSRLPQDQFSVDGTGRVFAPPNIAEITLGVHTEKAQTAEAATKENVEKMNRVIEAVKKAGVETKDIKTTDYQLYADYNYPQDSGRELSGWNLSQRVRVKIRKLDSIGDVIAKATAAGANQTENISFTIDDEEVLKKQARGEAIEKAKAKAEELSKAAGIKLGKVINVYESYSQPPITLDYYKGEGMGGGGGIPAPSLQPGENEIVVNVTMVYKVK